MFEAAKEAKKKHRDQLRTLPNVIGFGVGYKITDRHYTREPCLRVYVTKKRPIKLLRKAHRIPRDVDGMAIDVIELGGTPRAAYDVFELPIRPGAGVSPTGGGVGTLGGLFLDATDGTEVLLSNNHAIAWMDNVEEERAFVGDEVWQAGRVIATLKRWVEFEMQPTKNQVDGAIAEISTPGQVSSDIREVGVPTGYRTLTVSDLGAWVQKTGVTSGHTSGAVFDVASDVTMSFGEGENYDFEDQLLVQAVPWGHLFTESGDSGSLMLDEDYNAVGLFYGHIPGYWAWCNHIGVVMNQLNITGISKERPCITVFIGNIDVTRY